jgi:hypothetical protein
LKLHGSIATNAFRSALPFDAVRLKTTLETPGVPVALWLNEVPASPGGCAITCDAPASMTHAVNAIILI